MLLHLCQDLWLDCKTYSRSLRYHLRLEWLLEKHPGTAEQTRTVLRLIGLLRAQGFDWDTWVGSSEGAPFNDTKYLPSPPAVTLAEGESVISQCHRLSLTVIP